MKTKTTGTERFLVSKKNIEYRAVATLVPYAKNARTHSDEQIAQIARSIKEFGWTNPVLIKGNGIIAGHGRWLAAKQLGLEKLPCIELAHLTPTQVRAYIIADNKLALNAGWDLATLQFELAGLKGEGFDLGLVGFGDEELAGLLDRTAGLTDPDEAPEPPKDPVSRTGDLWVLGRHRLLCGDSTVVTDVGRVLGDIKPLLMVTDPPYGVDYDPDWRNRADRANGKPYGARAIGLVKNDTRSDWREAWALFPGDVVYVWHPAGAKQIEHHASLEAAGFSVRMQIIWTKSHFPIGRGNYHVQHEPCWYAIRKGSTAHWAGDRKQTTLWQIPKPAKSETGHSTQKPVECMRRPIENNSSPGQAVYEPFSGSGTTIIAAEMTGRSCLAIEIAPEYVDVAVVRWQVFTGGTAVLEGTKFTFADLAVERKRKKAS